MKLYELTDELLAVAEAIAAWQKENEPKPWTLEDYTKPELRAKMSAVDRHRFACQVFAYREPPKDKPSHGLLRRAWRWLTGWVGF